MKTKKNTKFCYLLIVIMVTLIQGCSIFSKKPEPDPQGTLGAGLQPYFNKLSNICSLSSFNSIPLDFDDIRSKEVSEIPAVNLSKLFSFIFYEDRIENFATDKHIPGRNLVNYKSESFIPDVNADNLVFTSSCITRLKDIAKADGKVNFGAASITGAIDAQKDINNRRDLVVIGGQFHSPFSSLSKRGKNAQKTNQYFQILDAYENNNLVGDSFWYLDNVNGWLVSWITLKSSSTESSVNLSASASNIAATISNDLSMGLSKNLDIKLSEFKFFHLEGAYGFQKFPPVDDVIKYLENTAIYRDVEDEDLRYATPGGEQKHMQVVSGMPESICNGINLWDVTDDNIKLENVIYKKPQDPGEEGECQFLLRYTSNNNSATQTEPIFKNYKIDYKNPVKNQYLKIEAKASIPFLNAPLIMVLSDVTKTRSDGSFSIPFKIDSKTLKFELNVTTDSSGILNCGSGEYKINLSTSKDSNETWYINGSVPIDKNTVDNCSLAVTMGLWGKDKPGGKRPISYPRQTNASIKIVQRD